MRTGADTPPIQPGCRVLVMRGTGKTGVVAYRLPASPRVAVHLDAEDGGGTAVCGRRELVRLTAANLSGP